MSTVVFSHPWSSFLNSYEKMVLQEFFKTIKNDCKLKSSYTFDLSDVTLIKQEYICMPDFEFSFKYFSLVEVRKARYNTEKYFFASGTLTMITTYTRPRVPSVYSRGRMKVEIYLSPQ